MSKEELNVLQDSINKFISSVKSFLSTSSNYEIAFLLSGSSDTDEILQKVLFEISSFEEESEILVMVGSIFSFEQNLFG